MDGEHAKLAESGAKSNASARSAVRAPKAGRRAHGDPTQPGPVVPDEAEMARKPSDTKREAHVREVARALVAEIALNRDVLSRMLQAKKIVVDLYGNKPRAWRSGFGFGLLVDELKSVMSERELTTLLVAYEVFVETPDLAGMVGLEGLEVSHLAAVRRVPIDRRFAELKLAADRGTDARSLRAKFSPPGTKKPGPKAQPPVIKWLAVQPPAPVDLGSFQPEDPADLLSRIAQARMRLLEVEATILERLCACATARPKILLAGIESSSRTALRRGLERLQVEVREFGGEPCPSEVEKYDVAVIDVMSQGPSQDGLALARRLISDEVARRVVLLASHPEASWCESRALEQREQATRELAHAILRCVLC